MKTCFLLLSFFLFLLIESQSQVLNGAVADSLYGKTYRINQTDTNVIKPIISGEGAFWDFSNAESSGMDSVNIIDPNNTPYNSSFTESNLCFKTGDKYYYYTIDSHKYTFDGEYNGTILYQGDGMDSELLMKFPFTMENKYKDTFTSSYNLGGFVDYFRKGLSIVEVDATGTLVLPDSTIEKVVRVHIQETFYDSIVGLDLNTEYKADTYNWYQEGDFLPLVSYSKFTNLLLGTTTYTVYYQRNPIVNSINKVPEEAHKLSIYPNPTNGIVNIKINSNLTKQAVQIQLVSIDGRVLSSRKVSYSENGYYRLDYSSMAKGIYYIIIKSEVVSFSRKLIVE